jgi:ribulose-phosphate 3-epimerase
VILSPSILAADLGHLADEVAAVERGGAAEIHVDIMDGQFVPNLTLGPAVVRAVRRATELPIDVHLMVERAERHLDAFIEAGASSLHVHVEAVTHLQRAVAMLKERSSNGTSEAVVKALAG